MREAKFSGTISGYLSERWRRGQKANAVVSAALVFALFTLYSRVEMTPESLDFATVPAGTGSVMQVITITNHGASDVHPHPYMDGPSSADFRFDPKNCQSLKAGASCTLLVEFRPTQPGAKSAHLVLADFGETPLEAQLSGLATSGIVTFAPEQLVFPDTRAGQESNSQSVRLASDAAFHIRDVRLTGSSDQFRLLKNDCLGSVAPVSSCEIAVAFAPQSSGNWNAALIVDNGASKPPLTVSLTGVSSAIPVVPAPTNTGRNETPPPPPPPPLRLAIRVEPSLLKFTSSKQQFVTVYNVGAAPLKIGVQLAGNSPDRFSSNPSNCGTEIPIHQSCQIAVGFKPKLWGEKSAYDARLDISHNVSDMPTQTVALQWQRQIVNVPQPHATVTPGSLDFPLAVYARKYMAATGPATPRQQSITILNDGPVDLKDINLRIGFFDQGKDSGFIHTTNCHALARGQQCSETVTFAPKQPKNYKETLYVFEGPLTSLATVELTSSQKPQ